MTSSAKSPEEYLQELPGDRKEPVNKLRNEVLENLPPGFIEEMGYGMIGYVIPHEVYPAGYHCNPSKPLPFANIASQKNFIAFYHMGLYAMPKLMEWFVNEYKKKYPYKLDMGKSCIRFKKPEHIPTELIGKLMKKVSAEDWIACYEKLYRKGK